MFFIIGKIEQPEYYENFDFENIVTPLNIPQFSSLLKESEYDEEESKFLINGFANGFSIGYDGPTEVKQTAPNLKFRGVGNKTILWNKVMKEVRLCRYAGPFKEIPFDFYIQSPIGLVPKDGGRNTCLIFHLSYPRGRNISVNDNTPKEQCPVHYPEFDKAIQMCLKLGVQCYLAKSDMTSAFRNLGIRFLHWRFLIMKAESPIDGVTYYFVDKCLPFGAAISCAHFQRFSNAVAHIVRFKTKEDLVNYLDDYLFAALMRAWCNKQVQIFLDICKRINFPVSMEKTFWGSTSITFLGLLIDAINQIVSVPVEKIKTALSLINQVLNKRNITLKQLQKIAGFLNFLGRAVVPGRAFTRRLYLMTKGTQNLKPHHHLRIKPEIKKDLEMWSTFLQHPTCYSRPFLDFDVTNNATEISMFSDASRNRRLGFGSICQDSWTYLQWDEVFMIKNDPSIEYVELFAVLVSVKNWLDRFRNQRIVLFCDNQAVVSMINNNTSSCPNCLALIRILVLHSMIVNTRVFATYISSRANKSADLLSRLRIQKFKSLNPNVDENMTPIPTELWPMDKIWTANK